MPQLMPLMWMVSVVMMFLLIFVLVDMYYYCILYNVDVKNNCKNLFMVDYKW